VTGVAEKGSESVIRYWIQEPGSKQHAEPAKRCKNMINSQTTQPRPNQLRPGARIKSLFYPCSLNNSDTVVICRFKLELFLSIIHPSHSHANVCCCKPFHFLLGIHTLNTIRARSMSAPAPRTKVWTPDEWPSHSDLAEKSEQWTFWYPVGCCEAAT
jgi:hypothetical protein